MATHIKRDKITPCLWFNFNAEEAVNFYISVFKNSKIKTTTHYTEGSPGSVGKVMVMTFEIEGQEFMALNGGPQFTFSEAISFNVTCDTQKEIDFFWEKLSEGGAKSQCGWLKDKFGLSWQIVPTALGEMMTGIDPKKLERVMGAVMKMGKIDLKTLQDAYDDK